MSKKAQQSGADFVRQYNGKSRKANRHDGNDDKSGNFLPTSTGDLKPSRYHAKKRPSNPHAKKAKAERKPKAKITTPVPTDDKLPKDHALVEIKSQHLGYLLGAKHEKMMKRTLKYPRTKYQVMEGSLWIWGPNETVDSLRKDIQRDEQQVLDKYGSPVPNGALLAGHSRRCIAIPELVIGRIVGKNGNNLKKLREECDSAGVSIHMNNKTREMSLCGESVAVDAACETVVTSVEEAKVIVKRQREKTRVAAEKSREKKMTSHEKDLKQFSALLEASEQQAKQKRGEALDPKHKESKRKEKQAAKDAARQARTLTITKEDYDAAKKQRKEESRAKKKNQKKKANATSTKKTKKKK